MNRRRLAAAAAGFAAAALGLGLGLSAPAGAATSAAAAVTHAGPAAPRYVVLNCTDQDATQTRPGIIHLACADNGIGLTQMHWTSWTPELASAYGTEWQNLCQPDCATGHRRDYPVVALLWGSAAVNGHPGERRYTEVTLSYPKARPAVYTIRDGKVVATYPVSQTLPLGM